MSSVRPVVSVIIPAHNAASTISKTLESARSQTFHEIEVIVVDDGSTDDTLAIARRFGPPIRCISQENQGVSRARNRGIEAARGGYIALLDADDVWHPEKLARQVATLQRMPYLGGVYVGVTRVSDREEVIEQLPAKKFDDLCESLLLHSSVIPSAPSSLLLRREALELVGHFDPEFSQCADWDFLLRASQAIELGPIDHALVRYRTAQGNMSSNIALLETDTFAVLDKFYSSSTSDRYKKIRRRVYSNHWLILSGSYLHDGQTRNAFRCLSRAFQTDPTNLRYPLSLPLRALGRARAASNGDGQNGGAS